VDGMSVFQGRHRAHLGMSPSIGSHCPRGAYRALVIKTWSGCLWCCLPVSHNYDDLGGNYFDRIHSDGLKRYLVKRLQQLGHKINLEPIEAVLEPL